MRAQWGDFGFGVRNNSTDTANVTNTAAIAAAATATVDNTTPVAAAVATSTDNESNNEECVEVNPVPCCECDDTNLAVMNVSESNAGDRDAVIITNSDINSVMKLVNHDAALDYDEDEAADVGPHRFRSNHAGRVIVDANDEYCTISRRYNSSVYFRFY